MRAKVTRASYTIKWAHFNVDKRKVRHFLRKDEQVHRGILTRKTQTVCEVKSANKIGVGYAYLHPLDTFDIEKGRKISLAKALQSARLSKRARGVIWKQYLARNKN